MPIAVTLPDGTERLFPDGTATADIESQLGGALVPVQEPNPAAALRRSSGIPVPETETPSMAADLISRFQRRGATAAGQTMQGISRLGYAVGQALGLDAGISPEQREARLAEISPMFRTGQDIVEGAREAFVTDPARDKSILSLIAESAGGMVPTIATGGASRIAGVGARLLGGAQYGLSAYEQGAQEAIAAGRPDLANAAGVPFALLGAATEGLLGVAPRVFSGAMARSLPAAIARGAASEAAQETLEQAGQNVLAAKVLGYDPERPLTQNLAESAIVGAVLGGGLSGIADLPNLRRREPRLKTFEREAKRAGFDLENVIFDPTPKIIRNDRAIAELAAVREQLAAGPNPELEARLPVLQEEASRQASVEAALDPATGKLVVHLPAIKDRAHLRDILREEKQHLTLATPEGVAAVQEFVKSNPLAPEEVDALKAYIQREDEADDAYRARLSDEYLAKLNRGSWWKRWTGEAVAWLKSKFGWDLTNEQAGRLVLRNLRGVASVPVPSAPVVESKTRTAADVDPISVVGQPVEAQLAYIDALRKVWAPKGLYGRLSKRWVAAGEERDRLAPLLEEYGVSDTDPYTPPGMPEGSGTVGVSLETLRSRLVDAVKSGNRQISTRESAVPLTDSDKEYFAALEKGDTAKAQGIVDSAAKAAGYTVGPVWHGTREKFTVFDADEAPGGFHFGTSEAASKFGPTRRFFLRGAVKDVRDMGRSWEMDLPGSNEVYRYVNRYEDVGSTSYVVSDPEQAKLADPITKDDAGNIIPPSQRFQPESPDIRFSLSPVETYPTAPIVPVDQPGIRTENGIIQVGPDVTGDSPELKAAVTEAGVARLPDPYLEEVILPILRTANPRLADSEAGKTGLTGAPLARHLLALEMQDWRIREASGFLPWRMLYRLAQAFRLVLTPRNERQALRAIRRILEASAEQYRTGEPISFDETDQRQVFVDRNARMAGIVAPLVRSLRARLSEDRALYSREFRAAQDRLNELATLARTRRLGEQIQQNFNPRSAKFLEEIADAGVVPSERDVALWREYQTELKARGLARKMDALEAAEASLANIARIDPRLDVAALKRRVERLTKSIAKADVPTTERARVIRADRKAALDRDAAARVLEDPQIAEWAELLAAMEESGLQPRPVTGTAAADVQEAGNYFAMEFDEFAQRVQSELDSFTEERFQPRMRALRDRLTALKKTEGETEVAMREVLAAARGKADRSGSAMSREAMAAMREIDAQIVRFAFGLAQAAPETEAGKLRDALLSGEVPVLDPGMVGLREVASSVGLAPEVTNRILTLLRDDPEFRLVVEEMFDSSEKAVREHVFTTIELIEDVYAEGRAQLKAARDEAERDLVKESTSRKADELARRALARMRRERNGVRREIRDAERDVFDLSAELLEKQTLAGLAKAGLEQLGDNRPHVRRMVYMAPGKGGEVLAEFGDQPEVRIPPDQSYSETTIHSITVWMANARKAIEEQSEDAPTLRGLEIGIKKAASLVERMFTPDHLEKTLRPNTLLDAFASSWLRTPAILSKLVPGIWSRLIDQRRADRDKAVRKANAIQQRTASKRRKLIVSAAESLGLDLFRRSGDPGILFDAYNEVAHQLRQHGSGVEVGQRFWLLSLRNRGARITSELLNLIRFDRAVGKELQSIEELRPYGGVRMRTSRGREIVRPSAPTGDIGLARLPKQQPLEDLVAAYDRAKASYPNEPQRERDAQLDFWNDNVDAVASHIRDASRNDLLDERDPLLGPAEESLTRAITSGGQEMPETIGAWVTALADRLPKIGPWGNVETPMGAPNPDGIEARVEWAETALLGELSRYVPLARQRVAREQNGPARSSLEVAVRDDQNEFTMGAAQLAFPSAWYQYGASDSYRDMVNRITAPATVEYANSLDNAAKDLRTKAARIEDAKKQADPGPALEELAADIRWHTGAKGPISVDLAERAADKMKRRAQAIEDYASKLRNPDFRTPPLPARLLSFSYGALLSTPTSWASNVFGGPITAYPVLSQFMAGPKAGLAMAGLLGASPIHGLLWEGSPFFPGLRKIGEWAGLLGPNETVAFLEGEGAGASWSRLDAADAEAWSAGQVTGKRARAAYERLKEAITGLSNVAGVGRGDVATNLLNARVTVPLALKALQGQARIAEAAKTAGVELPATDVTLKTREFLSAYGDPDTVLTEIAAMDARRWWKTELGATLGYDILTQLNVASASNRPDTNWLVGLLGWTSQTLALFLGNSRLPANASALRKGAKYLIAPTAMALASALSFWVQAGGRAWTKETFAKLSGELAIALSGVPDEGPGDDDERFYWRALDWLSDNVARVLALLHVTWATAPASAIAGGIARSFQPAARPMPWEQGFWLRPGSQIVADIADSATGGIGFSVTDPSLPAISLLKNAVKSSTQIGRGILGLADGEETRAAAFADIKGGARGAANFLGAWGAALAEAVLPGGNAGRESRRLIQSAARDAGIVLRPGEAPDGWSAPLSLRKELLAAGVRYVEGDESAIETIRGLASFSWQRTYDRAIEQGSSVSEAEDKASNAVKAMLPSLDPVRNALGRSAKAEELAKLGAALASPAVQRDTKAARAVVDVLERRPPARMRSFRASASARSPLKAGRRSAGPKARSKLRLSVPRV